MTKEIYKYPYNSRTEDEIKVFLSDKICEQVVKVNYNYFILQLTKYAINAQL